MITALIIEDELPNIKRLEKCLLELDVIILVVGRLQTVKSSVEWFQMNTHPDIVFMDVQLTDGNSFEIFNQVEIKSSVIFITAYDEYALKAFQVNGVDYLLKPLETDKLERSVRKVQSMNHKVRDESLVQLIKNMQHKQEVYRSRFLLPHRDRLVPIGGSEVAYFKSANKNTYLITHNGDLFVVDQTLEELEKEMDPANFFRLNRQYFVSLKCIKAIHLSHNGQLKIELAPAVDEEILISRERSNQLKKWLNQA